MSTDKKLFKSVRKIRVEHERGTDFIQIEGTVIEEKDGRVYLSGLLYDFSISTEDFLKFNVK